MGGALQVGGRRCLGTPGGVNNDVEEHCLLGKIALRRGWRYAISLGGSNLRDDLLEGLSPDAEVAAERVVERDDHDQGFIEGRVGSGTVV